MNRKEEIKKMFKDKELSMNDVIDALLEVNEPKLNNSLLKRIIIICLNKLK